MGLFSSIGFLASLCSIEMATGSLAGNVSRRASSSNSSKCSASVVTPALFWVTPGDDMGFSAHRDGQRGYLAGSRWSLLSYRLNDGVGDTVRGVDGPRLGSSACHAKAPHRGSRPNHPLGQNGTPGATPIRPLQPIYARRNPDDMRPIRRQHAARPFLREVHSTRRQLNRLFVAPQLSPSAPARARGVIRGFGVPPIAARPPREQPAADWIFSTSAVRESKSVRVGGQGSRPKPLAGRGAFRVRSGQCPTTTQRTTGTRSIYPAQRGYNGRWGFRLERSFRLASQHFMRRVPNTSGGSPSEVDFISAHVRHDPPRCAIN
jgi:hypothetical protein